MNRRQDSRDFIRKIDLRRRSNRGHGERQSEEQNRFSTNHSPHEGCLPKKAVISVIVCAARVMRG